MIQRSRSNPHQGTPQESLIFTTPDSGRKTAHLSEASRDTAWVNGIPGYNHESNRRTDYWRPPTTNSTHWEVAPNYCHFQERIQSRHRNIVSLFPFHEACWNIMEEAASYLNIPVDIQAIYEVALTFHLENMLRTYIFMRRKPYLLDVLLRGPMGSFLPGQVDTFTPVRSYRWYGDPYRLDPQANTDSLVKGIQKLAVPAGKGVRLERTHVLAKARIDPFSKLPPELLQEIFAQLPLKYVGHLRVASRLCAAVTISSAFFRDLVHPRGPLGYLLKLADANSEEEGRWMHVYHRAKVLAEIRGLDHLKVPWTAALDLLDFVRLRLEARHCFGALGYHPMSERLGKLSEVRQTFVDEIRKGDPDFSAILNEEDPGAQSRQWLEIMRPLEKVDVSTISFHERQFITGLSFYYEDGTLARIGYIHPQTLTTVWTFEKARQRKFYTLAIAQDAMGVRGLRIYHSGLVIWAGDHTRMVLRSKKMRLRAYNPPGYPRNTGKFIDAAFDHLKLRIIA